MKRLAAGASLLILVLCRAARADEQPSIELLLPGGTLYSLADRSYRSLRLPAGWNVLAGAYSPDAQALALLLAGSGIPSPPKLVRPRAKTKPAPPPPEGPVNKTVRAWPESTRLIIVNRRTGAVNRSWRVPVVGAATGWAVSWTSAPLVSVIAHDPAAPALEAQRIFGFDVPRNAALKPQTAAFMTAPPADPAANPRLLAETHFQGKTERFTRETVTGSTATETSDFYRVLRDENARKDVILWEYRVAAGKPACAKPYACYTGGDVQFLSSGEALFLAWDGDLYALTETEDGQDVDLVTQLLPQYSHPWAIAPGDTRLGALDVETKVAYQPVTQSLSIPPGDNPALYAQDFCPTRSFNAAVTIGPYVKNLAVPPGYQVGPVDIGSFKDHAYTPVLLAVTWTAFHDIVDPVLCHEAYTVAPNTRGIVVSLTENARGDLQCRIQTQER